MICGLLRPDAGDVAVAGIPVGRRLTEAKAEIGYVPQEIALYPDLTGREHLQLFGRLYGLRGARRLERIEVCYDLVELPARAEHPLYQSHVGIQRCLTTSPVALYE